MKRDSSGSCWGFAFAVVFAALASIQGTGAFAQGALQLSTSDTDHDGVIDSGKLYSQGCKLLGGGLGKSNCQYNDFGQLNCPYPSDTCNFSFSSVPSNYTGDVSVWMWCIDPSSIYKCESVKLRPGPKVVKVDSGGTSYSDLSARWWQWLLSIPAAVNPNLDATGANCAQGQYDDVWFLAGAFGGSVERSCTVTAGKRIFFPVINTIAFKPRGGETLLDLRKQAGDFINGVTRAGGSLHCTIEGVNCFTDAKDPSEFRVRSPSFTVMAPARGVVPPGRLSVPGNTDPIVSDGYWVLLEPPALGNHTIQFDAAAVDANGNVFSLSVTYHLTVQ